MIDLRECKKGDILLTRQGDILIYDEYVENDFYPHKIIYPSGSSGSRIDSGHVMKNPEKRLDSDRDVIEIIKI